jgi:hypothetical protein
MSQSKSVTIEEILDAILLAEPDPSYDALVRWSAKYPEHRDALADFFATWGVQSALPETVHLDVDRIARRVVSEALAKLDATEPATVPAPRIGAALEAAGLTADELAAICDLDETLLAKLDRRLIHVATIPRVLLERIGLALGRGAEAVRQMLDGPPLGLAGARYKSKVRPQPFAQDFADAVRASTLPDEAKQRWIDVASRGGKDS